MGRFAIDTLPGERSAYLAEYSRLSKSCATHLRFCIMELEEVEPERAELCGILDRRYEIYAIPIPFCSRRWLALAIDTAGNRKRDRIVLKLLTSTTRPCGLAKSMAANQLTSGGYQWVGK